MPPFGRRCFSMNESSVVAITSTIASPIATMSRLWGITDAPLAAARNSGQRRLRRSRNRLGLASMATQTSDAPAPIARSLFAFSIFYGGMVCIAGVLGNKQVALGPLAVESGIFAFLLLVVTSSSVAELHGQATAKRLVLFGFIPLIVSLILSVVVLNIPASPQMDH